MNDCIFCKFVSKEIQPVVVYENENFLAFLDNHPVSVGHVLIIPKKHHRWVWDVPELGGYFEVAGKIAHALQKAFGEQAIWSNIRGEEVPHAHISVMPQKDTPGDKKDLEGNAAKIIAALKQP